MKGGANDNSRGDEPSELARPTISDVLAAYLADEKGRLAARTHGRYADVIDLLQHSLNSYGPNSLGKDEYELWEKYADDGGDSPREFCDIFGPEHILPNVGEFLGYFMIRKVMAGEDLLRASGTVTKKLAKWLAARGYVATDEAGEVVERGAEAARDLPRAEKLATLLYAFTSDRYDPKDSDIEDMFGIARVEPGKVWLEVHDNGRVLAPVSLPVEATKLCQVGWSISGAVRKSGKRWLLVEAWNVYP